jgi:hypothetical protein
MRPRRSELGAVDTAPVVVSTSDPMPPEDPGSITVTTTLPGTTPLPVNATGTTAPTSTGVSTIDWLNQQISAIGAGLWGKPASSTTNAAFVPESDVSTMTKVGVVSLFALAGYYLLVKSTTRRTR